MNSQDESKLRRIEWAGNVVRGVCSALRVPVIVAVAWGCFAVLTGRATQVNIFGQVLDLPASDETSRYALLAIAIITALVMLKALHHLGRLGTNYARREIFTIDSARQIRQFGVTCILWGAVKVVWAVAPLLLGVAHPAATSLTIDVALIGVVIVGLSWFAEMAAALREENDLTI